MQTALKEMSEEEFERHKAALAARRQEKPKQLTHRAVRYWSEITSGQYLFDRDDIEVDELKTITKQDLLDFFHTHVFHHAPLRRKMAVHIVAANVAQEKAEPLQNGVVNLTPAPECKEPYPVEDIAIFKRSLPLFPLVNSTISNAGTKAKL